jgi:hypothetical protein
MQRGLGLKSCNAHGIAAFGKNTFYSQKVESLKTVTVDKNCVIEISLNRRFSDCGSRPPGHFGPLGGGLVVCVRDIFILNELWAQYKTYFLGTLLG